jgi:hypothetical protein
VNFIVFLSGSFTGIPKLLVLCSERFSSLIKVLIFSCSFREHLFEEMLQEREDVAVKRKRCKEVLRVLQQAAYVSDIQSLQNFQTYLAFLVSSDQYVSFISSFLVDIGRSSP